MAWINGIEHVGGRLTPISIGEEGQLATTSLAALRSHLPPRGGCVAKVSGLALQSLELVKGSDYLSATGFPKANPSGHEIYCFLHDGRRHLVPAAVLLSALLVRLASFGERLLDAGSLHMLAQPALRDGSVVVKFHKISQLKRSKMTQDLISLFTWLTCFASARLFWASVHLKAVDGSLGCSLPLASIEASVYGRRSGGCVFVTRMSIKSLTPMEPPLPFAASCVPETFRFGERKTTLSSTTLKAYRAENRYRPPAQEDIPLGPTGWRTTEGEWRAALAILKSQGFICQLAAKESLDVALEKHGSGKPWAESGPRAGTAVCTYTQWRQSGKWAALKEALAKLRSARQVPSVLEAAHPPAQLRVPQGSAGWKMTDQEWLDAIKLLRSAGFTCEAASKGSIDIALEKHGSGKKWKELSLATNAPIAIYALWNRNGKWNALLAALGELRKDAQQIPLEAA